MMNTQSLANTVDQSRDLDDILDSYESVYGERRREERRAQSQNAAQKRRHRQDRRLSLHERTEFAKERLAEWKEIARSRLIPHLNQYQEALDAREYPADISQHTAFHLDAHESYLDRICLSVSAVGLKGVSRLDRETAAIRLLAAGSRIEFKAIIGAGGVEVSEYIRDADGLHYCLPFEVMASDMINSILKEFIDHVFR